MSIRRLDPAQAFRNLVHNLERTNQRPCKGASQWAVKKSKQLGYNILSVAVGVIVLAKEIIVLVGIVLVTPVKMVFQAIHIVLPNSFKGLNQTLDGLSILDQIARLVVQALGVGASVVSVAFVAHKGAEWNVAWQKGLGNVAQTANLDIVVMPLQKEKTPTKPYPERIFSPNPVVKLVPAPILPPTPLEAGRVKTTPKPLQPVPTPLPAKVPLPLIPDDLMILPKQPNMMAVLKPMPPLRDEPLVVLPPPPPPIRDDIIDVATATSQPSAAAQQLLQPLPPPPPPFRDNVIKADAASQQLLQPLPPPPPPFRDNVIKADAASQQLLQPLPPPPSPFSR